MSCQETLFKQLRERGFRLTPQREMILSVMHQMDGFATAEVIYEGVHAISSSVDISTVYRTLDLFLGFHVVTTVDTGDGQRRYRLSDLSGPKLHLVCRSCGSVVGFKCEEAQPLRAYLRAHSGFEAHLDQLSIPGLCRECAAARAGADDTTR